MLNIKEEIASLEEELIVLRRDFHMHPELGYQEFETSRKVKEYLESLGLEVSTVAKTGVVGLLRGGDQSSGKTVLLRSDMDALPVKEATSLPYQSKKIGVMHACGHDGHMAIQLIAAKILSKHKDELKGNVKFIFQPNEEEAGALDMINEGILEEPKVDAAFALHLWSPIESGKVGLSSGPILGTTEEFEIIIKGKSGHTSMPHEAHDALLGACDVVSAVQSLVTREFNPLWPIAIMFGYINGGKARNIITDNVRLGGTIRFLFPDEDKNKPKVLKAFERVINSTCDKYKLKCEINYIPSNPSLVNDVNLVELVKESVSETYENKDNIEEFKSLSGEDFAEISKRVPSVMTFVGICNEEKKSNYPHHHSHFDIDEDILKYGAELQVRNVIHYLNS